jgi:hypothetical protein
MEALSEAIERAARRRTRIRLGLAGLLLAAGVLASRFIDRSPDAPDRRAMGSVVFVDVEGWYARTPHEVAVASPFKLALDALPAGLPLNFGEWRGEDRRHDPEIDVWFRNPDVTIERTYRRADGEIVWLSAFGSRGEKSFHLFEHTPNLCYPLAGWRIDSLELAALPRGPRPLTVNLGRASGEEGGLVFLYLYVWDSPARAAEEGVLSVRIAAPVRHETEATVSMLTEEFLTEIFPQTLTWSRF